jgi:hypothetical protein
MHSSTIRAGAVLLVGIAVAMANGDAKRPPQTSTGRELTGPGAHHEEYLEPRPDSVRAQPESVIAPVSPKESGEKRRHPMVDTVGVDRPSPGKPVPGVDDKSGTRPGE